jgi:hypothetical protein
LFDITPAPPFDDGTMTADTIVHSGWTLSRDCHATASRTPHTAWNLPEVTTLAHDRDPGVALLLVCDRCANSLRAKDLPVKDFRLVWQAAIDIGWVGIERTEGPHYCPACADPADPVDAR